jgi:nucleoside-triphosphatase
MKILITGKPGCGKSTMVKRIVERLNKSAGGFLTQEIRKKGIREGFQIVDISSGKKGILAHVKQDMGPKIGKYKVNIDDLEEIGVGALEDALKEKEFIVIDEIGPMELKSEKFVNKVREVFESDKCVIATIHFRSAHPLVQEIKNKDVNMYVINEQNREEMLKNILRKINESQDRCI